MILFWVMLSVTELPTIHIQFLLTAKNQCVNVKVWLNNSQRFIAMCGDGGVGAIPVLLTLHNPCGDLAQFRRSSCSSHPVTPLILTRYIHCLSCCGPDEIPDNVCTFLNGDLFDDEDCNKLVVSLGFFSVIRIERPAQYLINAIEYSVPDKECAPIQDDDPFCLFRSMAFPTSEFSPPSQPTC